MSSPWPAASLFVAAAAAAAAVAAVQAAPAVPPVLPRVFIATLTNPPGQLPLTGTWYYDFDNQRQRVDGGNQASCTRQKRGAEWCTTYLSTDYFYVDFPFSKTCCRTSAPGLLRPDWIGYDNGTLVGSETVNGRQCDVWLIMGSSKNYWLETPSGEPCRLDDGGYNWTMTSFAPVQSIPADVTTPPTYCANAPPCIN